MRKPPADRQSESTIEIAFLERTHSWSIDIQDDAGGRRVPLCDGRVLIGSSCRADVAIQDPTVSACHCALTVFPGGIAIEDLDSTNGTYVGSALVREARGGVGASIVMGHSS